MFGGSPAFSSLGLEGEGRQGREEDRRARKRNREEIALIVFWQVPAGMCGL